MHIIKKAAVASVLAASLAVPGSAAAFSIGPFNIPWLSPPSPAPLSLPRPPSGTPFKVLTAGSGVGLSLDQSVIAYFHPQDAAPQPFDEGVQVAGLLNQGDTVYVTCQTTGPLIDPQPDVDPQGSDVFDRLSDPGDPMDGAYVPDYYISTPSHDAPSPGLPSC